MVATPLTWHGLGLLPLLPLLRPAGQPLSREQLIPEVGVLMVAGYDTSSHTIAWTL
jgi:cytochrome P450